MRILAAFTIAVVLVAVSLVLGAQDAEAGIVWCRSCVWPPVG